MQNLHITTRRYESKSWTNLVPDYTTRTWMTAGWMGYNLGALASDRSFGTAYLENASQSVTFDMSRLSGPNVLVRWYDPNKRRLYGGWHVHSERYPLLNPHRGECRGQRRLAPAIRVATIVSRRQRSRDHFRPLC
jgi:hypothetical protein